MDAGVGSEIFGAVDVDAVEGYEKLCRDGRKNAVCLEKREAMINRGGKVALRTHQDGYLNTQIVLFLRDSKSKLYGSHRVLIRLRSPGRR